ncbi:VOC family protein [Saccharomonospora sp. NPDC046836]|uniref:VOC family protein n=1 Tax=Saccharomonospora sp. NPDC046836 TaxID=3156921 RepID=UPI0033F1B4D6
MDIQLGYLSLGVSDLEAWVSFTRDFAGAEVSDLDGTDSRLVRIDDHRFRYLLSPTGEDDVREIGWEVPDPAALDLVRSRLGTRGHPYKQAEFDAETALHPRDRIVFEDPNGVRSVAYIAPHKPKQKVDLGLGHEGFVTGRQGAGHILLFAESLTESVEFYREVLDFRISDYCVTNPSSAGVVFLRCNPRHHTLALVEAPSLPRLNHMMFQCTSIDDVGYALDRARAQGLKVVQEFGRHSNDLMLSFYVESPSGFEVEYGWGGLEVDEADWTVKTFDHVSVWGHQRPFG